MTEEFLIEIEFAKVDEEHGLVFGYAIICYKDGKPYYDKQGDHIPEDVMITEALRFMENSRVAGAMHTKDSSGQIIKTGSVPLAFTLTRDIAKAMGIDTEHKDFVSGFAIGMKPTQEVLEKYKSGVLTGFSIGGYRIQDQVVEE